MNVNVNTNVCTRAYAHMRAHQRLPPPPQGVELRNAVSPRIVVLGDSGRLVQILNNLLGNAGEAGIYSHVCETRHTMAAVLVPKQRRAAGVGIDGLNP